MIWFRTLLTASTIWLLTLLAPLQAQDRGVWVQIEAHPALTIAQSAVRGYAGTLEDVAGFAIGSGWYAIALGPYTRPDADRLLRDLRARRAIPSDSYIVDGTGFRQQFWPVGTGAPLSPQPLPGASDVTEAASAEVVQPVVPDETRAQAQASERLLTRDEKRDLQVALQWAGFYRSTIDGLFGRGTRAAMRDWQGSKGFDATGVLTSGQRQLLFDDYNAILDGLDMARIRDVEAGISMEIPTGAVAFDSYNPPFARYASADGSEIEVLLISQPGTQARLGGLYEIMQTLEVVPRDGPRERRGSSFVIEGVGGGLHTHVEATLVDGEIKGFALVWPEGDGERRTRVLDIMRASFVRTDGVLDPSLAQPGEDQSIDLVSGLAIRKPIRQRSGVFVDAAGHVLTVAEAVANCGALTVANGHPARVLDADDALGLVILEPLDRLRPVNWATFQAAVPRIGAEIAVGGFPFGGVLTAPALTFGQMADIRGLDGEDEVKRLQIALRDGDAGGPVFDASGAVLGVSLPDAATTGPFLPGDVAFAADTEALLPLLVASGLDIRTVDTLSPITPERLTRLAREVTTLVSCWP